MDANKRNEYRDLQFRLMDKRAKGERVTDADMERLEQLWKELGFKDVNKDFDDPRKESRPPAPRD